MLDKKKEIPWRKTPFDHMNSKMMNDNTNTTLTNNQSSDCPSIHDEDLSAHPAYAVLRGYGKLKVEEKRSLLIPFTDRKKRSIDFFPRHMLDYDSPASKLLSRIESTGNDEKQRKSNWSAEVMADYILRLHLLLSDAATTTIGKPYRPCKSVLDFMNCVNPIGDEAIAKQEAEAKRVNKRSVVKKQHGRRIQDEISFDSAKREKQECPSCSHHFCMIVVDNRDEMNIIKEQYKDQLNRWEQSRASNKGKRPPAPKYPDSEIACYCFTQQCLVDPNGIGCLSCVAIANEGNLNLLQGIDKQGNRVCNCPVCKCSCSIRFARKDRVKVAQEKQRALEGNGNMNSPIVLDLERMVQSALDHGAIYAMQTYDNLQASGVTNDDPGHNTTAFATQHIIQDPIFQSAKAKKELQTAIGPKQRESTRANGKGIHELREQARQAPDAFNTMYGRKKTHPEATSSVLYGEKNKRFYSNGLLASKMDPVLSIKQFATAEQPAIKESNPTTPHSLGMHVDLFTINETNPTSIPQHAQRELFGDTGSPSTLKTPVTVPVALSSPIRVTTNIPSTVTTPATELVRCSQKRAFQQGRNKTISLDERKVYQSVTAFTQKQFSVARELAQLEIEAEAEAEAEADNDEDDKKTLSQKFVETLAEYHTEYNE